MPNEKVHRVPLLASITAFVSRLGLAHQLRRGHGLALSSGELAAGLRHGGRHPLPPALREAAAQDRHQFRLSIDVELFGGVKDIGKCVLLIHGNLLPCQSTSLPARAEVRHLVGFAATPVLRPAPPTSKVFSKLRNHVLDAELALYNEFQWP